MEALTVAGGIGAEVALACPAGTTILGGTAKTLVLLELRKTCAPPEGAAPLRLTVITAKFALETVDGLIEMPFNIDGEEL